MEDFPENVGSILRESKLEKQPHQRLWDMSLRFLEGRQWLSWNDDKRRFTNAPDPSDGMTRVTVNMLLNIYRNISSRLALAYPSAVVLPASPSSGDIIKAQSSETALRYYWSTANIEHVLRDAIDWAITTGTTALHSYYDPGSEVVKTVAHGAYDIFFERGVISPEDSAWIGLRTYHTRNDLKNAYKDKADQIESLSAGEEYKSEGIYEGPKDRVEVFEIYWRDGKHAIIAGDVYLFQEKLSGKKIPIQIIRYTSLPRRLWGISLLAPLLDLQVLYNKSRSQIIHNVETMGNPKWLVPRTAGISANAITNRPGEKVFFNPAGGPPVQAAPVPIPSYVIDNIARVQAEMGDVAGLHSVSLGKRAVGVTSGKAIDALSARDSSQLENTQQSIEYAVKRLAECILMLMGKFYSEEKMMRMLDETGRVTFHAIKGMDLVTDPEVHIETGSLFRQEAQDRDDKVLGLLQMGLLTPDQAIKELSFRTGNAFVTKKIQAMSHASDLLDAAKLGAEVEFFANDDLEAIELIFSEFMQTAEYYKLPEDRQEYIRDALVSVLAFGMPDPEYEAMRSSQTVFPRKPNINPAQPMGMPTAQQQLISDQEPQPGSMAQSEKAIATRGEANISPARSSGGY